MEYFTPLPEYRVMICNQCRYAVLPSQADRHLSSANHRVSAAGRRIIQNEIRAWPDLFQTEADVERLQVPTNVPPHFHQLTVYTDGRKCQICNHIMRTDEGIQKHYRTQHGWVNNWKKGRKATDRERAGLGVDRPWMTGVHCQRFFTHGRRQEFFEVQGPRGGSEAPESRVDKWEQARVQLTQRWTTAKETEKRIIQEGHADEVNPWLERTGWLPYLQGFDRDRLLQSVSTPDEKQEPVHAAMWQTMGELIQCCQHNVIHKAGIFVRMEAIRTEKHQTRYRPLQPYMNAVGLAQYGRPWKQILMFIARTQEAHDWESPPYQFTARQARAWKSFVDEAQRVVREQKQKEEEEQGQDSDSGEDGLVVTALHQACLRFCYELLDHRITRKEYDSVLICALAVLGVRPGGWMGADQYPPILSAVIKINRFMVVQRGLEMEDDEEEDDDETDKQHSSRVGCLNWVRKMMDGFMVRGTHSPMQWMLDLRTYGMTIHYNTTAEGHIDWQGDLVLYKQIQFTMGQLREMVHGLVAKTQRILQEELLFASEAEMPAIPWRQLRDDPINQQPGWNFIQDRRTPFSVDGAWWLFQRIGQSRLLQRRFTQPGPNFRWARAEVEAYMAQVALFREKLLVLMHITGGQPARGPEILSIRHSNTARGEHRNIFIEDGMVVFVTRYHKGYSTGGKVKIIHRYLPREVGVLWVWYTWLVLPFQQKVEVDVWQKEEISSHMWPTDANGRRWTSERMKKVIQRESTAGMGVALGIQSYRDLAIAISRRFLQMRQAFRRDEEDEDEEWDEDEAGATAAAQTGHTLYVEGMIYARGITERDGEVASLRARFRGSSMAWHQFLGFPRPGGIGEAGEKRRRAPFEEEYETGRVERWRRLRRTDIRVALKQVMGQQAEFRGVQAAAIQTIMAGESPVVAVMKTGGGKSLLFMLPAFCGDEGVSIVVVPLIALRQDMQQRCQAMGIRCREWSGRQPGDGAQVVLVTPESAVTEEFRTFLTRMRATQQLDRIVIDEVHVVLNEQMNFRKQLQRLGELCEVGVQMVCLTATLPPSQEMEIWRRMNFRAEEVRMFREATRRPNIRYAVQTIQGATEEDKQQQGIRLIRQLMRVYQVGKMVVYCGTVDKVKGLAAGLKCDAYYHGAAEKEEKLKRFMGEPNRVIVATSALGMGIDVRDIRVILHVDRPRRLLDYAQESGRAGRDGLKSEAIIVRGWGGGDYGEKREEVELVDRLMGSHGECRRAVLGAYLDGGEGVSCQEDEERCDECERREEWGRREEDEVGLWEEGEEEKGKEEEEKEKEEKKKEEKEENQESLSTDPGGPGGKEWVKGTVVRLEEEGPGLLPPTEGANDEEEGLEKIEQERQEIEIQQHRQKMVGRRGAERMQQEGLELEELEQQLQAGRGKCASCVEFGIQPNNHSLFWCREEKSKEIRQGYIEMKESIRQGRTMERFSGCMECFLPQAWCNQWEQSEREGGMYRRQAGVTCEFREVVLSGIAVGLGREGVIEGMQRRMAEAGFNMNNKAEALKYLGRKRIWGGLETSELLREFYIMGRGLR